MSLGSETVKHSIFRSSLIAALIALSGEAAAIGLGELRGKAAPVSYTHLTLPTIYSV